MIKDHFSVWDKCLETIQENINPQSFKTWFEPIKPIKLKGNSLTIQVPNNFFYEWLEENYVGLLKKSIREELGPEGRLEYQIVVENHKQTGYPNTSQATHVHGGDEIRNPFVIPGIKKVKIQPTLGSAASRLH